MTGKKKNRRTRVKDLPRKEQKLSKKEQKKVKGGALSGLIISVSETKQTDTQITPNANDNSSNPHYSG